ncbi:hypothetical protein AAMO2058_000098600 [Amorphochlora amoebiformis]
MLLALLAALAFAQAKQCKDQKIIKFGVSTSSSGPFVSRIIGYEPYTWYLRWQFQNKGPSAVSFNFILNNVGFNLIANQPSPSGSIAAKSKSPVYIRTFHWQRSEISPRSTLHFLNGTLEIKSPVSCSTTKLLGNVELKQVCGELTNYGISRDNTGPFNSVARTIEITRSNSWFTSFGVQNPTNTDIAFNTELFLEDTTRTISLRNQSGSIAPGGFSAIFGREFFALDIANGLQDISTMKVTVTTPAPTSAPTVAGTCVQTITLGTIVLKSSTAATIGPSVKTPMLTITPSLSPSVIPTFSPTSAGSGFVEVLFLLAFTQISFQDKQTLQYLENDIITIVNKVRGFKKLTRIETVQGSVVTTTTIQMDTQQNANNFKRNFSKLFSSSNGFNTAAYGPYTSSVTIIIVTPNSLQETNSDGSSGFSLVTVAVAVAVGVLVLLLIAFFIWYCSRKKSKGEKDPKKEFGRESTTQNRTQSGGTVSRGSAYFRTYGSHKLKTKSTDTKQQSIEGANTISGSSRISTGRASTLPFLNTTTDLKRIYSSTTIGNIRVYNEDEIKQVRQIGKGAFGLAFLANMYDEKNQNICEVVAKIPSKKGELLDSLQELGAMASIKPHNNVIKLIGVVTIDGRVSMITPFCELGSLDTLHSKVDMHSRKGFLKVAFDVSSGLAHLHECLIVHRDLACRNLLMKSDGTVVITDFGLSKKLDSQDGVYSLHTSSFPWQWTAPEAILNLEFNFKTDIWALGVTFWELLRKGEKPYSDELKLNPSTVTLSNGICNGKIRLKLDNSVDSDCRELVMNCLSSDPLKRPVASQVHLEILTLQKMSPLYKNGRPSAGLYMF